jgi:hypothetical protein
MSNKDTKFPGTKKGRMDDLFKIIAEAIKPKQPHTVRDYYYKFLSTFTVIQVHNNPELQDLYQYLKSKMGYENGNYIIAMSTYIFALINKYLVKCTIQTFTYSDN